MKQISIITTITIIIFIITITITRLRSPIVKDESSGLTEAAENWKSKIVPGALKPRRTPT